LGPGGQRENLRGEGLGWRRTGEKNDRKNGLNLGPLVVDRKMKPAGESETKKILEESRASQVQAKLIT
jgi:hypothetical protein